MFAHPAIFGRIELAMRILAISGSLRAQSTNTALLGAAALVATSPVDVVLYGQMESLPPFNPDLDLEPGPEAVLRFRAAGFLSSYFFDSGVCARDSRFVEECAGLGRRERRALWETGCIVECFRTWAICPSGIARDSEDDGCTRDFGCRGYGSSSRQGTWGG
jgi:hypothetical protein